MEQVVRITFRDGPRMSAKLVALGLEKLSWTFDIAEISIDFSGCEPEFAKAVRRELGFE